MNTITLAAWKRGLRAGMRLRCTYRWYWEQTPAKRPASGEQVCLVKEVRATQLIYSIPDRAGHERVFMYFPKAKELKATPSGFELYFPDGRLMSRYEYLPDESAAAERFVCVQCLKFSSESSPEDRLICAECARQTA